MRVLLHLDPSRSPETERADGEEGRRGSLEGVRRQCYGQGISQVQPAIADVEGILRPGVEEPPVHSHAVPDVRVS